MNEIKAPRMTWSNSHVFVFAFCLFFVSVLVLCLGLVCVLFSSCRCGVFVWSVQAYRILLRVFVHMKISAGHEGCAEAVEFRSSRDISTISQQKRQRMWLQTLSCLVLSCDFLLVLWLSCGCLVLSCDSLVLWLTCLVGCCFVIALSSLLLSSDGLLQLPCLVVVLSCLSRVYLLLRCCHTTDNSTSCTRSLL